MDQERSELEKSNGDESEKYDSEEIQTADEASEIRSQIEETRAEMSETINAIEEKFDIEKISEKVKDEVSEQISEAYETVKDTVYNAISGKAENFMSNLGNEVEKMSGAVGHAGSYVVKGVKQNPLPWALVGLGFGLLYFSGGRGSSASNSKNKRNYANGKNTEQTNSTLGYAKQTIGGAADSVSGAASAAYEKAGDAVSGVGEYARDLSETAYSKYEDTLSSNPLVVGAVALGLGAAVALAIPSTNYEDQWMGETKDNLVSSAGSMAQNVVSQAKEAVGDFTETASKKMTN